MKSIGHSHLRGSPHARPIPNLPPPQAAAMRRSSTSCGCFSTPDRYTGADGPARTASPSPAGDPAAPDSRGLPHRKAKNESSSPPGDRTTAPRSSGPVGFTQAECRKHLRPGGVPCLMLSTNFQVPSTTGGDEIFRRQVSMRLRTQLVDVAYRFATRHCVGNFRPPIRLFPDCWARQARFDKKNGNRAATTLAVFQGKASHGGRTVPRRSVRREPAG